MFKKQKAIWPGIIQHPVNAGSRKISMKTTRPIILHITLKELEYFS